MITNAEMTIFNACPDQREKKIVYIPHFIGKVWFHKDVKISSAEGGFVRMDVFWIRVPEESLAGWLPPEEFSGDGDGWTVQNKDFFILGKWEGTKVKDISDVRKIYRGTMGIVNSHSENFFGTSPHIRIGGGA